jgi:ABC-type multidrug transport system permease subunit
MSRSAVLVGRTVSDVANNLLVVVVMSLTGLVVGWRIRSSVVDAIIGYLLLLLWAYAFSWIMAYVGLLAPSPEVVNNAAFIVIFPVTFISNAFVPLETLPGVLKTFAAWNPLSAITQACREWFGNIPANVPTPDYWSLQHATTYSLIWIIAILAIFVPLATRQYNRAASR